MKTLILMTLMFAAPVSEGADPEALFREGSALFDAADYDGAVEKFTGALSVLPKDANPKTRLMLLFNIATAHEKQFSIDRDVTHLRQALTLYERYKEYAQETGDLGEELDIEVRIARVRKKVLWHDQIQRQKQVDLPDRPPPPPSEERDGGDDEWKKSRNVGIGLVAAGGAATIGGVVLAAVGSGLEDSAREQVDELGDLGLPEDHPAWQEGADFVEGERRRGNVLLGTGIALSTVGVVGVGVGSYFLVKSKKMREANVSVVPTLSRDFAGFQVTGRF